VLSFASFPPLPGYLYPISIAKTSSKITIVEEWKQSPPASVFDKAADGKAHKGKPNNQMQYLPCKGNLRCHEKPYTNLCLVLSPICVKNKETEINHHGCNWNMHFCQENWKIWFFVEFNWTYQFVELATTFLNVKKELPLAYFAKSTQSILLH
jgi:hypothetical protein